MDPRERFASQLHRLWVVAGQPPLSVLAEVAQPAFTEATAQHLLSGQFSHAPRWELLSAFVDACAAHGRNTGESAGVNKLADIELWQARYKSLVAFLDDSRGTVNDVSGTVEGNVIQTGTIVGDVHLHAAPAEQVPSAPVGLPFRDLRPIEDLGVHATILNADGTPAVGDLPHYILRDHDYTLRDRLRRAAEAGPELIVLHGLSCVGKSRAAYEAVRAVLVGWTLFQPRDADSLREAIIDHRIAASTVVWLDDARVFFDGSSGQRAAAALRELLRPASPDHPNSIIVLASMWTSTWEEYRKMSGSHIYKLLTPARGLIIEEDFLKADAGYLDAAKQADSRVREAIRAMGERGRLTQYLGGGVFLEDRYRGARDVTRAVLDVALDAYRLGVQTAVPVRVFRDAAASYLKADDVHKWSTTNLDDALREVQCDEPTSALRSVAGEAYVLADYLAHNSDDLRSGSPTWALWIALDQYVTSEWDRNRIALRALRSGMYRLATVFWTRSASGRKRAINEYAREKIRSYAPSRPEGSHDRPWGGMPRITRLIFIHAVLWVLFFLFLLLPPMAGSLAVWVGPAFGLIVLIGLPRALSTGEKMWNRSIRAEQRGDIARATRLATRAIRLSLREEPVVDRGELQRIDVRNRIRAGRLLSESGRYAKVVELLPPNYASWLQTDVRHRNTSLKMAWIHHSPPAVFLQHKQWQAALEWLADAYAGNKDGAIIRSLAELMGRMNQIDEAIHLLQREVEFGGCLANRELARLFVRAGRVPDLIAWLHDLAANDYWRIDALPVVMDTVDLLLRESDLDEATRLLESYVMPPRLQIFSTDPRQDARLRLAMVLYDNNRRAEARRLYDDLCRKAGQSSYFDCAVAETGVFLAVTGQINVFSALFGNEYPAQQAIAIAATGDGTGARSCAQGWLDHSDLFTANLIEVAEGPEKAIEFLVDRSTFLRSYAGIGRYLQPLVGAYFRSGKVATAARIYRYGIEPNGRPAKVWYPNVNRRDLLTGQPIEPEELDTLMGNVRTDHAIFYAKLGSVT